MDEETQTDGELEDLVEESAGRTPEDAPVANEEAGDEPPAIPAVLQEVAELVAELGGAAGFREALEAIKANHDERRESLIAEIKGNSTNFTDGDLAGLDADVLAKIATAVRPTGPVLGRPAPVTNGEELEDYVAPTVAQAPTRTHRE